MLRWLLLILLVYLAYRWWSRASLPGPRTKRGTDGEAMVACAHCGIHIPQSEAVAADGKYFCSDAHRLTWTREH